MVGNEWRVSGGSWVAGALLAFLALIGLGRADDARTEASARATEESAWFREEIYPIIAANCFECHGGEGRAKSGLYLTSREGMVRGGERGPAVSIESPAKSLLLRAISYRDDHLRMPPRERLEDATVAKLARWIELGAPWDPALERELSAKTEEETGVKISAQDRAFWSFQPPVRPEVPRVEHASWPLNPIDSFVLAKLEAAGLEPNPPATPIELVRRLYFDVTGLPPEPAAVQSFIDDPSPEHFARIADDLLASERYGERWARHWLDVVRFAETHSFERDNVKPNAWRYRDWVIESLNEDKPYDRFVLEQLAGDELDAPTAESIIATGYYRLGPWDDEPTDPLQARYDELDDIVATTGQTFLGLTLNCARCHDHKLDPIPQEDYYRVLAFFHGVLPTTAGAETTQREIGTLEDRAAHERETAALEREREALRSQLTVLERQALAALTPEEREIAGGRGEIRLDVEKLPAGALCKEEIDRYERLRGELAALEKRSRRAAPLPRALCVKEGGPTPPETFVLIRGNAHAQGKRVEPGFPQVFGEESPSLPVPKEGAESSGRRRAFAEWLVRPDHPLTARVIINRVWQHHFGRGIVRSPNNFGLLGDAPTHPGLLDWLATELVANGWSLKKIHRLILTSNTYRMSSQPNAHASDVDPRNELFWRFDVRRLEAEAIRDSILAVNGELNLEMGGPGIYTEIPREVLEGQSRPGAGWGRSSPEERARRSIYIHVKRSLIPPFLEGFDFADTDQTCPERFATVQPTQALTMLNSDFIAREARAFASRLRREAPDSTSAQVERALWLGLSRPPREEEIEAGLRLISDLERDHGVDPDKALELFAVMVFNLNEFIYVE